MNDRRLQRIQQLAAHLARASEEQGRIHQIPLAAVRQAMTPAGNSLHLLL